jgi:hypothetical protein
VKECALAERHKHKDATRVAAELALPTSYYLDESDPDILILHREDDSFVAAFSAQGATKEGIVEAAKEDYWHLLQAQISEGGGDKPNT